MITALRDRIRTDSRVSSIVRGGASGLAGKGLILVINAITLPLTVRYLGKLEYGIWVTISTSVVMLAVLDLGIANTLTNFISRAHAEGDERSAQHYFATALWISFVLAAVIGVAGAVLFRWIPWDSVFHLEDPLLARQARLCVAIAFAFFLLSLPLNLANKVLSGYQEVHLSNLFAAITSLMGLVAIVSTVLLRGNLVTLTTTYCAATLAGSLLLNVWLCLWHRPGIAPWPTAVRPEVTRELFGEGFLFFILQLAGLVVFNSDNLVITHYLGASEVTPYSVAWRLCGYAAMFQSLLVPSLWPAFSEAYHRADMPWIRSAYRRIMQGTLLAVGAAALLIGAFGRPIIRLWAGPAAVPSSGLLWLMALWVVLLSYTVNQATLLAATRRIQIQSISSALAAVVNLILSIVLVQRIGSLGVLLGTTVSYVLFVLAPQGYEVRRVLRGTFLRTAPC